MNAKKGFTLIELLCVVAIMVLLMALVIPAVQGTGASTLTTSGARLSSFFESARQTAILARQPVAVAMLPADSNSVQRFTALGYSGSSSWTQISKWNSFPPGILAASGTEYYGATYSFQDAFAPGNSPTLLYPLPSLSYSGATYQPNSTYGYIVFLADGSLFQDGNGHPPIPCMLRLAQGITNGNGGVQRYTGPANPTNGGPANFCDIIVDNATGQVKIMRP